MPRWTSIPVMRDALLDRDLDFDRPMQRIFDQNFGLGLREEDIVPSTYSPYYSRGRRLYSRQQSGVSEMKEDGGKLQILLDVQQFAPSEIAVKTVDNVLLVEAKHEERKDEHGVVERSFTRKYELPSDCEPESVVSSISQDGVLTITAPKKSKEPPRPRERAVPINITEKSTSGEESKKVD